MFLWCSIFSNQKKLIFLIILAALPSAVMVLVRIVVHLGARQWVNWGRRQGNVGPAGTVGFAWFGSGLGLLLLSSLPTCAGGGGEDAFERYSRRKSNCGAKINYKAMRAWDGAADYSCCFCHVTNGFFSRTKF